MKKIILLALFLGSISVHAQINESWTAFRDSIDHLIGFKNGKGEIKIEPKFMGFTMANRFDDIMAVMEIKGKKYISYYLTKSGKVVGRDSLFTFDNSADCESEGFIRFKDKKTDKVGLFNKEGQVVIPAIYEALSPVHNGMLSALQGAKKKYWEKHNEGGCNHYSWSGGENLLLNTSNEILARNFENGYRLNFHSLKIEETNKLDSTTKSFKGVNGKFYIFSIPEKKFAEWFKNILLKNLTQEKLEQYTMDSLVYWRGNEGWVTKDKTTFTSQNFALLKKCLLETAQPKAHYFISTMGMNPFMYEGPAYYIYYNNCGQAREDKYPVMNVVINTKNKAESVQNHFDFLTTPNGYRLISITIWNGILR